MNIKVEVYSEAVEQSRKIYLTVCSFLEKLFIQNTLLEGKIGKRRKRIKTPQNLFPNSYVKISVKVCQSSKGICFAATFTIILYFYYKSIKYISIKYKSMKQ